MNTTDEPKYKIWNSEKGISTTVSRTDNGGLLFDYYDCSANADEFVGGEIAYLLTLPPDSLKQLKRALRVRS